MATFWMDNSVGGFEVGQALFLVTVFRENTGVEEHTGQTDPCRTNLSRERKLRGWCGSTNNVSRTANGLVRVRRISKSKSRMCVTQIQRGSQEEAAALEELGYPELAS